MEDVEDRALSTYHSTPIFFKRYVDDVCTALKVDSIEEFHHYINSVEETIQFTMEEESDGRLAFLDTEIIHHGNGSLTTKVYRKKTHTNKYLSFKSDHPLVHKKAVVKTLSKSKDPSIKFSLCCIDKYLVPIYCQTHFQGFIFL